MSKTWCILALLATLALAACGGGGGTTPAPPGTPPPAITAISPLTGGSGDQVTFTATTSGSAITNWNWNFGGGAIPNSATQGPQVTVKLGAAGDYTCKVEGENAWYGTTTYFSLHVTP